MRHRSSLSRLQLFVLRLAMTRDTRDQLPTVAAYIERFRHSPGVSKLGLLLEAENWALHVKKQRSSTATRSVLECPEATAIRAALLEHGCLEPHWLQRAVEYNAR